MPRNEKTPGRIAIRPFAGEESEVVAQAFKSSDMKKPEFYTQAIVLGCKQMKEKEGRK